MPNLIPSVFIVVGLVLAAIGYFGAFGAVAASAVQQTVLELRLLNGTLGLLLTATGVLILHLPGRATVRRLLDRLGADSATTVERPPAGVGSPR